MSPYRRFHPVGMDEQCGAPHVCEIPHSDVVPETGLEPVRGCPQRFLRPLSGTGSHGRTRIYPLLMPIILKALRPLRAHNDR